MVKTNKQIYNETFAFPKNLSHSLEDIAKTTQIPMAILKESFKRGVGAWRTNIRSVRLKSGKKEFNLRKFPRSARMTAEQWAASRVYSMVVGGLMLKKTKADPDLQEKVQQIVNSKT